MYLLTGLTPVDILKKSIRAINGNLETINLYSNHVYPEEISDNYKIGWWNPENAIGEADIPPEGGILGFSSETSAFYSGGKYSLICDDFIVSGTQIINVNEAINSEEKIPEALKENDFFTNKILEENISTSTQEDISSAILNEISTSSETEITIFEEPAKDAAGALPDNEYNNDISDSQGEEGVIANENQNEIEIEEVEEANDGEVEIIESNKEEPDVTIDKEQNVENETSEEKEISAINRIKDFLKSFAVNAEEKAESRVINFEALGRFEDAKINLSFALINKDLLDNLNRVGENEAAEILDNNIGSILLDDTSEEEEIVEKISTGTEKNIMENLEISTSTKEVEVIEKTEEQNVEILKESDNQENNTSESAEEEKIISKNLNFKVFNKLNSLFNPFHANAQINEPGKEPKIIIWYSLGHNEKAVGSSTASAKENLLWQKLDSINTDIFYNNLNNGYLNYDAPFIRSWEDIKNLKIKLEGQIEGESYFMAYLDSIWVEARYEKNEDIKKLEKRRKWQDALDLLSKELTFSANEAGELKFKYYKNENKFWDSITRMIGLSSFWEDIDIKTQIVDPEGKIADIGLNMIFEEDGEFTIKLPGEMRGLKPGKYKLRFIIKDNSGDEEEILEISQDFLWGVIAMNFNKSVYLPDEKAYIQMAVLDDNGHTICDADITLEIRAPNGDIKKYSSLGAELDSLVYSSPDCGPKSVSDIPDYHAYYNLKEKGEYKIKLIVKTLKGAKTIKDKITVKNELPLEIERIGPTRIYPKSDYEMILKIKANENYRGDIQEYMPGGFKVINNKIQIINSQDRDPYGSNYRYYEDKHSLEEKLLIWQDVEISAGDVLEIVYAFDAPDESPEFYLLGPLITEIFIEERQWQIAADAVNKRARTVTFFAGAYSGGDSSGQSTNQDYTFSSFNFRLAETGVDIKSAFIIFESQFEAYTFGNGNYTGYKLAFDSCEGATCGASAFSGITHDDSSLLAYNEGSSNQARLLYDITQEADLAAYTGGGALMEAQAGYHIKAGSNFSSIANAKALLVITYTYDVESENITNTVAYPLESTDTTPAPDDSGSRQNSFSGGCARNTDCPVFDYNMEIPEWAGVATATNQLSQWFRLYNQNDSNAGTDINNDINIQDSDQNSGNFHHESQGGGTQGNMPAMYFSNWANSGYEENAAQQLEYYASAGTNYLAGGEVFETYMASSSAPIKTRTVSFPIGVVNDGRDTNLESGEVEVFFPENGSATGTVAVKKAWVRLSSIHGISAVENIQISTKTGGNATSSIYTYNHNPGGTMPKPLFSFIHVIPAGDYGELEKANASNAISVKVNALHDNTIAGVTSAELMITYTYTAETDGYLTSLQLFAGQLSGVEVAGATTTVAKSVAPETGSKKMLAGGLQASYLVSDTSGIMSGGGVWQLDADIATDTTDCTGIRYAPNDNNNACNVFFEFNKNVAANLTIEDDQSYEVCYASDEPLIGTDRAKMSGFLTYTYQWDNSPPSGFFITASTTQKQNGSGVVDIGIEIDDPDDQDCRVQIEYATGTTCVFSPGSDLALDETDVNISADFGDPDIENDNTYQIGEPSAYIQTVFGSNSVFFDWQAKEDLGSVEGNYCLQITANDLNLDDPASATTTVYIDTIAPTAPGALSFLSRTGTTTTLFFGATSTETNFFDYIIYYKPYDGTAPDEGDSPHSSSTDINLANKFFNGATTTTITGLSAKTTYSYAIWAYDAYGNKASSSRVDIMTNDAPNGSFAFIDQKNDGSGAVDISINVTDVNNDDSIRAKVEYKSGDTCGAGGMSTPILDENTDNISSTYGSIHIDNNSYYQVGTTSFWIIAPFGSNTVDFDWFGKINEPAADDIYCMRLTIYDGMDEQYILATATTTLDNKTPTSTGALAQGEITTDSIQLIYAASSPGQDTNAPNSDAYKIFYKPGVSGVTEGDLEKDNSDLNVYNYNGATSTIVSGLNQNTWYVFNIWTYDKYGNKASSSEIAIKTNATISNNSLTFINAESSGSSANIAVASGTTEWIFRAVVTETSGWYAIASTTLRLANNIDSAPPFNDLEFYWDQTANAFYEIGNDALNAAALSNTSTSTCMANTCSLDFRLIFNKNFTLASTDYSAELVSGNDSGVTDSDTYTDFYQVRFPYIKQIHYRWRHDDGGE